jgi:FLVCR family MFS transporter
MSGRKGINAPLVSTQLAREHGAVAEPSEPSRWYVLFVYSYISALQSLLWITWSSVPTPSSHFICETSVPGNVSSCETSPATLDMFLDEGPIAYCCAVPLAAYLLSRRNGLRRSIILGSAMCLCASVIRSVPIVLGQSGRAAQPWLVLSLAHVGQTMNAAVAPLVVASPAYLSLVWFPASQRNTATSIANVANALGRAVGFYLGPAIIDAAVAAEQHQRDSGDGSGSAFDGSSDDRATVTGMNELLLLEILIASVPFVCAVCYMPNAPTAPPSLAAMEERRGHTEWQSCGQGFTKLAADARMCMTQPSLVLLMLGGGLQMAMYGGWSGVLTPALTSSPVSLSMKQAGLLGTLNTLAGMTGGVLTAMLCDTPRFNRSLKQIMTLLCTLSVLCFGVMAMAVPNPFGVILRPGGSPLSYGWLALLCTAAGFFRGGLDPLYFELVAEEAHPIPAGTAGGVLTFFYHALLCVCLTLPPAFLTRWLLVLMAGCMVVSGGLLGLANISYKRSTQVTGSAQ